MAKNSEKSRAAMTNKNFNTRLQKEYYENIRPALLEKGDYKNPHQVPKLEKIVLNMGVGDATQNRAYITKAAEDLTLITGQKAIITKARKSNASFKVRDGMAIGCKVTLRRERMYEFLDRLVTIAMPRIRDFRGVSAKSFDGRGNYAMGIKEHIVFPEINYDTVDSNRGMDIVICTTTDSDDEARELLRAFKMPFNDNKKQ